MPLTFEYRGKTQEELMRPEPEPVSGPPINCPGCGRFCKYLSTRHYYNGTWDCITLYVLCSRCGEQGIECV